MNLGLITGPWANEIVLDSKLCFAVDLADVLPVPQELAAPILSQNDPIRTITHFL
jgi:hypothetical protein